MNSCTSKTATGDRRWLADGLAAAWPICLGYLPLGFALGVLGQEAGLGPLEIGLMSVMVFAGSAQFIAVAMIAAGGSPLSIVATTFMVNIRHVLMSSALAVHLQGSGRTFISLFAYGITDESFAVNMGRFRQGGWGRRRALVVNQAANTAWVISTVVGAWVGGLIPAGSFGIDYALIAMFLCLLVFQLLSRLHLLAAGIAALVSVCWAQLVPGNSNVLVASIAAASAGYVLSRRRDRGRR